MRIITLEDLHVFQTVVREGGVLRAADALNRVPSNVTTRIKRFEARLGENLFKRRGRSLVLTDAGQKLLGHADRMLKMASEVEQDMTNAVGVGPLRLGSLESAAAVRLPELLARFHMCHPEIAIDLCTGSTGKLLDQVHSYSVEAVFVSEPFNSQGLNGQVCFQEELVLITTKEHADITSPKDLRDRSVAVFPHGCSYRRFLLEWLASSNITPKRIMEMGSYHAIVACVSSGAAVGILPASVLSGAVHAKQVKQHRLPENLGCNRTHLVWKGEPGHALQRLIAILNSQSQPEHD